MKCLLFRSPLPKGEGGQASLSLEPGAAAGLEATLGATSTTPRRSRSHSHDSAANDDLRRCTRCGEQQEYCHRHTPFVTDLQGPPSERTQSDKIRDLKSLAKQYARDRESCDDTRISYLEYVESEAEADWTLARMIAG
jgi:hypothetical protein